ncbi:MAG TPA: NlpC/P60 family protein [Gaiellaceae bacterium]|nr:NlpC/P60 family protein [Gaiellaceae bacterium]
MPTALLATLATLVAAVPALADPRIAAKKAEAQQVMAQIQELDSRLEKAVEAYDAATVKLDRIRGQLAENRYEMRVAKQNLKSSETRLAARLRDLYVSGEGDSTIAVILGAASLDDVINRLDTASRVSSEDTQVVREVKRFRSEVARRGAFLRHAHQVQKQVVAERAAAKRQVEQGLAERQRLLSSIRGEIQKLQQEEAVQQALLAARARARLIQLQREQQARLRTTVVGVTAQVPASTTDPTSTTDPASVATVAPPSRYGGVVGVAMAQLGKPYVWGTAGPDTFDCSGLVVYAYAAMGVSLPHSTYSLWNDGVYVPQDQLQPGDLVFFDGLGHVGIYIGGGQFIHAPHTGDVVKISSLSDSWYAATYVGARRIL